MEERNFIATLSNNLHPKMTRSFETSEFRPCKNHLGNRRTVASFYLTASSNDRYKRYRETSWEIR